MLPDAGSDRPRPADGEVDAADAAVDAPPPVELACDPALTIEPLVLHADYCVISRAPVQGLPGAFNVRDDRIWTFEGRTTTPSDWRVERWVLDGSDAVKGPEPVFTFTPTIPDGADKVFASEYLALSPSELAAVGYTGNVAFKGTIVWGDESQAPKTVADANGNYWVAFYDDRTLLINGLGVGDAQDGQAVYIAEEGKAPRVLIKDMGSLSGPLAMGETLVFAGGLFGNKNNTFAFTRDLVDQAIANNTTLTPEDGSLIYEGSQLGTTVLGDDLVVMVMDAMLVFESVSRYQTTRAGDVVSVSDIVDIVKPFGSLVVGRVAGDGQRLGLLLRKSLKTEIALLQPKK